MNQFNEHNPDHAIGALHSIPADLPRDQSLSKPAKFKGTDNPRWLRAIHALLTRPTPREQLDEIAGCANSPEVVRQLRALFEGNGKKLLVCERIKFIDRDGRPCEPGVYAFSDVARKAIYAWLARRKRDAVAAKSGELPC
jgi:hypothetical protein